MKKFEELSEEAKKVAIQNHHDILVGDNDWFEPTVDIWKEKLEELGYEGIDIMFNGFWSQGDGACFEYTGVDLKNEKVKAWLFSGINSEITDKIIKGVDAGEYDCDIIGKHSGHYYHEHSISHYLTFNLFDDEIKICGSSEGFNIIESQLETNAKKFQIELSKKIYNELEKDYESQTDDKTIGEILESNEYEFNEDGSDYKESNDFQNEDDGIIHLVYSYTDKWDNLVYTDKNNEANDYFIKDEVLYPVLPTGNFGEAMYSAHWQIDEPNEILNSDKSNEFNTVDKIKFKGSDDLLYGLGSDDDNYSINENQQDDENGYSTVDNDKFGDVKLEGNNNEEKFDYVNLCLNDLEISEITKGNLIKKFCNEVLGLDYDDEMSDNELINWFQSDNEQKFVKSELDIDNEIEIEFNFPEKLNIISTICIPNVSKLIDKWVKYDSIPNNTPLLDFIKPYNKLELYSDANNNIGIYIKSGLIENGLIHKYNFDKENLLELIKNKTIQDISNEPEVDEKSIKPIDLFEPQDLIGKIINLKSDNKVIEAMITEVDDLDEEFEITYETKTGTFNDEKTFILEKELMNFLLENGTINFDDNGTDIELTLV